MIDSTMPSMAISLQVNNGPNGPLLQDGDDVAPGVKGGDQDVCERKVGLKQRALMSERYQGSLLRLLLVAGFEKSTPSWRFLCRFQIWFRSLNVCRFSTIEKNEKHLGISFE